MSKAAGEIGQTFGEYLAGVMRDRKISGTDIENATGVSQSLVTKWKANKSAPSVENLRRLGLFIEVPLLQLLVKAGHLTATEARVREVNIAPLPTPPDGELALTHDPRLSDQGRTILLAAYQAARQEPPARRLRVARTKSPEPPDPESP